MKSNRIYILEKKEEGERISPVKKGERRREKRRKG
jgi:hypothetical protein